MILPELDECASPWLVDLQTIDSRPGYAGERGECVRFGNHDVRMPISPIAILLRDMARHGGVFRNLFGVDMERLLAIRKRSPRNCQREDVTWLTGDATPLILAVVNWKTNEFRRMRPGEVLSEFRSGGPRYGLISECELAVIAVCMGAWAIRASHQFCHMGSDNMNAIAWTPNGTAKQGPR